MTPSFDHVDYNALDAAKNAFIAAGKKTALFAKEYGRLSKAGFGASANVFTLPLAPFWKAGDAALSVTLLPEGLGTSDDARPADLTPAELRLFWKNIGLKTVAVMTNDAAAAGMQTVLISLYLPSSEPEQVFDKPFMDGFLKGFTEGCKTVKCVYFSGETPQLKGKIEPGKLDIAGALFGVMPPGVEPVDSSRLAAGDTLVFVESSGPHDNGFTTLRALAKKLPQGYRTKLPNGKPFWQAINAPTVLYTPLIQAILAAGIRPTALEPITGHGWQKIMRSKKALRYVVEKTLPYPPLFDFIEKKAGMTRADMLKVFNCGAGLAVFTKTRADAEAVVRLAAAQRLRAVVAGRAEKASRREVVVEPWGITLTGEGFGLKR